LKAAEGAWATGRKNCPGGKGGGGLTGTSLHQRLGSISVAMADASICSATARAYEKYWKVWQTYMRRMLSEMGFAVGEPELLMHGWDREMQVVAVRNFYAYCYGELGMVASSVEQHSSGVKRVLRDSGSNVDAFDDERCKQVRAGSSRMDQLYREPPRKKLPMSSGMVRHMVNELVKKGGKQNEMIAVAVMMGFFSALRVGEYICTDKSVEGHAIQYRDVAFLLENPLETVGASVLYLEKIDRVVGVQVTLRSAKNDQRGSGSVWTFYQGDDDQGSFFISFLAKWAVSAHAWETDPFLSWRNVWKERVSLGYRVYNDAIKKTALGCGYDDRDFSSHSVRIGALTQLSAAGVPVEIAQRVARHRNSATTLRYQAESVAERDRVMKALVSEEHFGDRDLRALATKR
jgi:hypothetical protein